MLAAMMLVGAQARADQGASIEFDVSIRGLSAAHLTIQGNDGAGAYAAKGTLKSAGLLSFVKKIRYDAEAKGRLKGPRFTPTRYFEKANTGKRQSEAVMDYKGGVPLVKVYNPPKAPRPGDLDPATQGGTVDPLTALYAVLRDVPRDQACNLKLTMFDGRRRSQVVLGEPVDRDGVITCAGEYRRLKGFSDKEMAEKQRFPFDLTYGDAPAAGMVHVTEISMDTLYGNGRMIRQ